MRPFSIIRFFQIVRMGVSPMIPPGEGIRAQFPQSRRMKPIFSVSQLRTPDTPIRLTWPERRILLMRYLPIFLLLGILLVERILMEGWFHGVPISWGHTILCFLLPGIMFPLMIELKIVL